MSDGLNDKQKAFCREYIVDWNASQAAIRAGYSEKTCRSQSSALLTKQNIKKQIKILTDEALGTQKEHLQYQVLNGLKSIAFTNITDVVNVVSGRATVENTGDLEESAKYAIEEISETITKQGASLKIKMHSKLKALELLGKYGGMFDDTMQVSGNLTIEQITPEERKKRIDELQAKRNATK